MDKYFTVQRGHLKGLLYKKNNLTSRNSYLGWDRVEGTEVVREVSVELIDNRNIDMYVKILVKNEGRHNVIPKFHKVDREAGLLVIQRYKRSLKDILLHPNVNHGLLLVKTIQMTDVTCMTRRLAKLFAKILSGVFFLKKSGISCNSICASSIVFSEEDEELEDPKFLDLFGPDSETKGGYYGGVASLLQEILNHATAPICNDLTNLGRLLRSPERLPYEDSVLQHPALLKEGEKIRHIIELRDKAVIEKVFIEDMTQAGYVHLLNSVLHNGEHWRTTFNRDMYLQAMRIPMSATRTFTDLIKEVRNAAVHLKENLAAPEFVPPHNFVVKFFDRIAVEKHIENVFPMFYVAVYMQNAKQWALHDI